MPEPAPAQPPPAPPSPALPALGPREPGWASRVAWWIGWVLLAVVSFSVTYGVLLFAGR
jgi:hypothetical protein